MWVNVVAFFVECNQGFVYLQSKSVDWVKSVEIINEKETFSMAKKIEAWTEFGPRLEPAEPMTGDEIVENIVKATNQSKGSVLAVLAELDVQTEAGLKSGRIVQMPNGTHFRPTGKADGAIEVDVRVNPEVVKNVNDGFRGKWRNGNNIGKSEAEIIAQWNAAHPEDPVEA